MKFLRKNFLGLLVACSLLCMSVFAVENDKEDILFDSELLSIGSAETPSFVVPPQPVWSLKSEADELLLGDTTYVTLGIAEETSVYAFEGELHYDASKLELKKADFPEGGISKLQIPQKGVLQFVYSCLNENIIKDSSKAAQFQFICLSNEDTTVSLTSAAVVNAGLAAKYDNELSVIADVKMKKPDPPKKPSGGGGGGGGFHGGSNRPQVSPSPPAETVQPVEEEDENKPIQPSETILKFQDLQGFEWAEQAITYLNEQNILLGTGGGNFEPSRSMTRAEAAKLLTAAFPNESAVTESLIFSDVENGAWYTEFIRIASERKWITGYEDGSFQPEQLITREDFSVILMRIVPVKKLLLIQEKQEFIDSDTISDYAVRAVSELSQRGIIQGDEAGAFLPQAPVTRAEAAKMVYSILKSDKEEVSE